VAEIGSGWRHFDQVMNLLVPHKAGAFLTMNTHAKSTVF
jgi:hypothetical protein